MSITYHDIAKMIDHSLLNPTLTQADLHAGIDLALRFDVASVCILPYALKDCAEQARLGRSRQHDDRLSAWRAYDSGQDSRDATGVIRRRRGARHGREYQPRVER